MANYDPNYQHPVIVNTSAWTERQQDILIKIMVSQLAKIYGVEIALSLTYL